jgi:plastocyanin domain-containing protein
MKNTYGIISNGAHIDVSNTEKGAKQYATKNGYTQVSIRYNGGYIAQVIAERKGAKWVKL